MNLWLDDVRDPNDHGAIGYVWVKTVAEAQRWILAGTVEHASLDHDLGICVDCRRGMSDDEWVQKNQGLAMPHCTHVGTGYTLCLWMAETGHWPREKPTVHSQNPLGAKRMRGVIERYFGTRAGEA
jgi:hypothetical protein